MITAILKNWELVPMDFGKPFPHYRGEIFNDVKNRFKDGEVVRTSPILSGPDKDGVIITKNSTYKLEPYPK